MALIRIEAPHFTAAVITRQGKVVKTAPILHYMKGWTRAEVRQYVRSRRNWKMTVT